MAPRRKKSEITYTVERIVDCQGKGKEKRYLIKWEGYPKESNTWEPPSCIIDKNLIKVFEEERRLENAATQVVATLDQTANQEKPECKRPRSVPSGNENGKKKPNASRKSETAKAEHGKETKTSQELGRGRKRKSVKPPPEAEHSSKKIVTNDVSDVAAVLPETPVSVQEETIGTVVSLNVSLGTHAAKSSSVTSDRKDSTTLIADDLDPASNNSERIETNPTQPIEVFNLDGSEDPVAVAGSCVIDQDGSNDSVVTAGTAVINLHGSNAAAGLGGTSAVGVGTSGGSVEVTSKSRGNESGGPSKTRKTEKGTPRSRTSVPSVKPTDPPNRGVKNWLKAGSGQNGSSSIEETLKKNQVPAPVGSKKQEALNNNRAPGPRPSKKQRISESDVGNDGMDPTAAFKCEPEVILGVTDFECTERLHFLVKWKGHNIATLVPAVVANENWPQVVIKYYEKCLRWHPAPGPGPEKRQ